MRIVLDTNVLVSAALKRSSMAGMAVDMVERRGGLLEEKTGQRRWETELHRLEGIALVGLNRLDEGQRALSAWTRSTMRLMLFF
jgi:hypothetical protein